MCGIFGIIANKGCSVSNKELLRITQSLFVLSESRGKEASGFAGVLDGKLKFHKTPEPGSKLIKTNP